MRVRAALQRARTAGPKRHRTAMAVFALVGSFVVGGASAAWPETRPVEPASPEPSAQVVKNQPYVSAIAQKAEASAKGDAGFSSISVDPAANKVFVYHTGRASPIEHSLRRSAGANPTHVQIETRPAVLSHAQSNTLLRKLRNDDDWLHRKRIRITSLAPAQNGGPFTIRTKNADRHGPARPIRPVWAGNGPGPGGQASRQD